MYILVCLQLCSTSDISAFSDNNDQPYYLAITCSYVVTAQRFSLLAARSF
jgi:hypothetical protein